MTLKTSCSTRSSPLALATLIVATIGWSMAAPLTAQSQITAIVADSESIDSSDDVRLLRFADASEELSIAVGTELEIGDLLSSISGLTDIEIACGEDTLMRFSGGFRVLIDAPEATDCAVNFLSGTLDVLTDEPTEVDTGAVILGSEGTQYTVELSRVDGRADRRLLVFDGKVRVRGDAIDQQVETGRTWRLRSAEPEWGDVAAVDLDRTSQRYAMFDASRITAVGAEKAAAVERLRTLHYQVLSQPESTEKRVALAKEQLEYARTPQALYHLRRGEVTTPSALESHAIDPSISERIAAPLNTVPRLPAPDPFALIESGAYLQAIAMLQAEARTDPGSRVYCGLARAYLGHEGDGSLTARTYADRALEANTTDRQLAPDDALSCRRIQRGY